MSKTVFLDKTNELRSLFDWEINEIKNPKTQNNRVYIIIKGFLNEALQQCK